MRPYLAILKDSFREAFASYTLWVLLIVITITLALLAPFGLTPEAASMLQRADLLEPRNLLDKLAKAGKSDEPSAARRVWENFPDEFRERAASRPKPEDVNPRQEARFEGELRERLNKQLDRRDLYDRDAWQDVGLRAEAETLIERGVASLTEPDLRRLNRLLLEAAFPKLIRRAEGAVQYLTYFTWKLGDPLPFSPREFQRPLQQALVIVINLLIGRLGVFIAILVTASLVPHTFEAGAIDLLLSKPVSRVWVFLTKFAGGCAFILINGSYLIAGLWLIAGLRFDFWTNQLLWCIPVLMFLFAICYSVSALAGVIWRNAIVSVVLTIVFWVGCSVLGVVRNVIDTILLTSRRLEAIVPAGESLLVANRSSKTLVWEPEKRTWEEIFKPGEQRQRGPFNFGNQRIGPVYDPTGDRLLAVQSDVPRFAPISGTGRLQVGLRDEDWRVRPSVQVPAGTSELFVRPDGEILIAGVGGVHRFDGDPAKETKPIKILGFDLTPKSLGNKFVPVSPEGSSEWAAPFAAAMRTSDGSLVIRERKRLLWLSRESSPAAASSRAADSTDPTETGNPQTPSPFNLFSGSAAKDAVKYTVATEVNLDSSDAAVLACAGKTVVVASNDGRVRILDAVTLAPRGEFKPFGNNPPRIAVASPDGRWFAVVSHNRRLWLYDAEQQKPASFGIAGQGDISAATLAADNRLFVADRFQRVTEYKLDPFAVERRFEPDSEMLEMVYRYAVDPLYLILPKPAELDNVVSYLLTKQETAPMGEESDLRTDRVVIDVWSPIWSNLGFLVVVLGFGCVYIWRKDF
jgi:ABC-type transport system involved in multi-copper enzyme maturation permease subunit